MATVRAHGSGGEGFAFSWEGARVARLSQEIIDAVCQTLGDRALAYMRSIVPVDTGFLRSSTFVEILRRGVQTVVVVGASAGYAIFVELGTRFMEAQPFIRPTFDWLTGQLPIVIRAEAAARGVR